MIKIGIIGGAGYTAGELLRILLNHPAAEITFIHSSSNFGKKVYKVHKDLIGDTELVFNDIDFSAVDVIFLCMGHGKSREFFDSNKLPEKLKIIDLSHDFRLKDTAAGFIYGLPELNKESISKANYIANPGCFATTIELALLPLAKNKLIKDDIHVNGITGSTGAGQNPSTTSHFSWRNNNISVYKAFSHQHENEIIESIQQLQPGNHNLNFLPVRGNFTRGIYVSAYINSEIEIDDAIKMYKDFYKDAPFVNVTDENPDLKQVVNTNKCLLNIGKHGDKLLIISMLDNLIKGASGQAVQNMNIMFGENERSGLNLKAVSF